MRITASRLALWLSLAIGAWMITLGSDAAKPDDPTRLERDRALAVSYWGRPCGNEPIEIFKGHLEGDYIAMALWDGPELPYTDCKIVLRNKMSWPTLKLCTVIVHEYGHLTGHKHSPNYWSIMYPYYVQPWDPCRRLYSRRR